MKKYELLSPACYQKFACKGGACRTTCCGHWRIDLTKEEYNRTRKKKSDLGKFVEAVREGGSSKKGYRITLNEKDECPFLTGERLCDLQLKFGEEILSATCRQFPRVYHKYRNDVWATLSLGCERTLELLLEERQRLSFQKETKTSSEEPRYHLLVSEASLLQYPVLNYYYEIQDLCISLLQAEDASLEDRMLLLGIAIKHIDELVKAEQTEKIPCYIQDYFAQLETFDVSDGLDTISIENIEQFSNYLMRAKDYMPHAGRRYNELLDKVFKNLDATVGVKTFEDGRQEATLHCSAEKYRKHRKNLARLLDGNEYFLENLMVAYLLYYQIPFCKLGNSIWQNYTYFVWTYGMLKFVLAASLDEDSTPEDLIDRCVCLFRTLGHNQTVYEEVLEKFEKYDSDSLAHIAIFLKS